MKISDILAPDRIGWEIQSNSKKRALEALSGLLAGADPSLTSRKVFDCLLARERLGSTGLGAGVALPHGRLAGLTQAIGAFIRLEEPVDFDAMDGRPVDLMFGLLVPEESTDEHLELLALLAEVFSDATFRAHLRSPGSVSSAFRLLTDTGPGG